MIYAIDLKTAELSLNSNEQLRVESIFKENADE